ncbi:MAG: PilZ domain-containing protein [Candidatus Eremiobacteraeota bacterium]|nr:PilZ domain-containing protein [Candidatus Eremiobacteraeota bacterium]
MSWLARIKEVVLGPRIQKDLYKDRRKVPRIKCHIEVILSDGGGNCLQGEVTDLEVSGIGCTVPRKLEKGAQFKIATNDFKAPAHAFNVESVSVEVIWCRKKKLDDYYVAGFRFTDAPEVLDNSWVHYVLKNFGMAGIPLEQRRKEIRVPSKIPLRCQSGENIIFEGSVYDISLGGIKMSLREDSPQVGQKVTLHIGTFEELPVLKCYAKILRSSLNVADMRYHVGAEFMKLNNSQVMLLGRYIKRLLQRSGAQ